MITLRQTAAGILVVTAGQAALLGQCGVVCGEVGHNWMIASGFRVQSALALTVSTDAHFTSGSATGQAKSNASVLARCCETCEETSDAASDAGAAEALVPATGTSSDSATVSSCTDFVLSDPWASTTGSALVEVEAGPDTLSFGGERMTQGAIGSTSSSSPQPGAFVVENGQGTVTGLVSAVSAVKPTGTTTLTVNGGLTTNLWAYFGYPPGPFAVTHPHTCRQIMTVKVVLRDQAGTVVDSVDGVGFLEVFADSDMPPSFTGLGVLSGISTIGATAASPVSMSAPVTAESQAFTVSIEMADRRIADNNHSQVADVNGDSVIDPIADRDAFVNGAAFPSPAYNPYVDFDRDGDNDMADYAVLDGLSELNAGCRVDYDGDNYVGNNDEASFVGLWFDQRHSADVGGQGGVHAPDGRFDNNDFVVFYDYFFAAPCTQ